MKSMSAHDHLRDEQFYHGTNVDLEPGDKILPRGETKVSESWPGNKDPKDKVWVTSNPHDAYKFAQQASFSRGGTPTIYNVEPKSRRAYLHVDSPHGLIEQYTANHATVLGRHDYQPPEKS